MGKKSAFIHKHFLLENAQAEALYHEYAKPQPIVDYHCHLDPAEIAQDRRWENISQIWLAGDHYKWRAMRTNGVDESFCTGTATDRDKFDAWAATVPKTLRNPLYHWTHLELKKPFGIDDLLLSPATAGEVWERTGERLADKDMSCRGIMAAWDVKVVCTTDDPVDSLEHHAAVTAEGFTACQVRPTWRPDKGMAVDDPVAFNAWTDRLAAVSKVKIKDLDDYRKALAVRHQFFHDHGCRLSDHGLDTVYATPYTEKGLQAIFAKVRSGKTLDQVERDQFKSAMLFEFAIQDHAKGWVQQYHIGAMRNNNTRMWNTLGVDKGFDSIAAVDYAAPLARLLDRLDSTDQLAKTILYNLNPRDNEVLATMIGNFQDGSTPGKLQFGSAWWFLDQKDGMEKQIDALSCLGLLSRFVGMLTDSRSFLSYSRHEYFRRILCQRLGDEMRRGLIPDDLSLVGPMVADICYGNAARYFDFGLADGTGRGKAKVAKKGKG